MISFTLGHLSDQCREKIPPPKEVHISHVSVLKLNALYPENSILLSGKMINMVMDWDRGEIAYTLLIVSPVILRPISLSWCSYFTPVTMQFFIFIFKVQAVYNLLKNVASVSCRCNYQFLCMHRCLICDSNQTLLLMNPCGMSHSHWFWKKMFVMMAFFEAATFWRTKTKKLVIYLSDFLGCPSFCLFLCAQQVAGH